MKEDDDDNDDDDNNNDDRMLTCWHCGMLEMCNGAMME